MFSFRLQKYKIKQHRKQFLPANRAKNRDVPTFRLTVQSYGRSLREKAGKKKFSIRSVKKSKKVVCWNEVIKKQFQHNVGIAGV
jgi:TPP-dependent pyruvate/acetoin dehydrogenase alpha subunit